MPTMHLERSSDDRHHLKVAGRPVEVLGRRIALPGRHAPARRVRLDDGPAVATFEALRRGERRGEHLLEGPATDGWRVVRRGWTTFQLHDPAGVVRASIRARMARPLRGMRQSWDLEVDGAPRVAVVNRGALNPVTQIRKELADSQLTTFASSGDEVQLRIWARRAQLEVHEPYASTTLAEPAVAATFLWIVHELYDHDAI